jgi:hypothetical protein
MSINKEYQEKVDKKATEENDLFYRVAASLILKNEHFKEGFIKGVEWQKNSIWRKCSEEVPTHMGEDVIVLCRNKNKPDGIWLSDLIGYWEGKWEPRVNYENPVYWTYVKDILPDVD